MEKEKVITKQSKVVCFVVKDTKSKSIQPHVRGTVKKGSIFVSDEWHAYNGLNDSYYHKVVDRGKKQYVLRMVLPQIR